MEFRILGPLEVLDEGRPIAIGAAKQRALLAVLLLHANEVVSTGRLIDALWGERPPASAHKLVQGYVSELRRAVGAEAIETRPPGYLARVAEDGLDLLRFRRLTADAAREAERGENALAAHGFREALALWRGPPLADVALTRAARPEAERLDDLRLEAVSNRVDADLACGRHGELVSELEALIEEQPLRERTRTQLMLALYRSGRQADALAVYRDMTALLREELGIDPGRELQGLERAILNQDPRLEPEPSRPPTNLPAAPTPLIGRDRELTEAGALLREHRLVTLTGPGGVGKTRLALELASDVAGAFPDGVIWVPLQALADPKLVLPSVAQAVGTLPGSDERIGRRSMLLVLDNFEHVLAAAPELAELLAAASNAKALVTSREPVHVRGEHEYPVAPLPALEAVALFTERARAVRPDFTADGAVEEICRRLDCLPLAVELAAARVKALGVEQLLQRLEQRLPLLVGGPREAPERQRTLRATIAWSSDLLSAEEQQLFARLGVFAGGCTLEGAEEICDADLDALQSLVDKSLVQWDGQRYDMLETIREFALECLEESGAAAHVGRRHAEYFVEFRERLMSQLADADRRSWWWAAASEMDNVRAAVRWSIEADDTKLALRLATAMGGASLVPPGEQEMLLRAALDLRGPVADDVRARALLRAGEVATYAHDVGPSRELFRESLEVYRRLGDESGAARALGGLGEATRLADDLDEARRLLEQSVQLLERLGDRSERTYFLRSLAKIATAEGDTTRARELLELSLAVTPSLWSRQALGDVELAERRLDEAEATYREALGAARTMVARRVACFCLAGLAAVAALRGKAERAGRLWGAALALDETVRPGLRPAERAEYEASVGVVRPDPRFEPGFEQGRELEFDEALEYALAVD